MILRANNRRRMFSYVGDYQRFLGLLGEALAREKALLHAVSLMTNHVHLIVVPENDLSLSRLIKRVAQRYAQLRNRRRDGSGKLFEERYWSRPLVDDNQLGVSTYYVEANAVRAGMFARPEEHRWSSYRLHAGLEEPARALRKMWTPSSWLQQLGRDEATRGRAYQELFRFYLAEKVRPKWADEIDAMENRSVEKYTRRLQRPNGESAAEARVEYGILRKIDI